MSPDSKELVWLITGTSSGLGRCLTLAALKRGDKVIATSRGRSFSKLEDLKAQGANILELDVTAPPETVEEVAKKAIQIYGRIDVLVHNAARDFLVIHRAVIVFTESSARLRRNWPIGREIEDYDQFNTHIFGPLNINRAFLPYMRERRKGTVVWVGSLGGWRGIPTMGLYCATKHAAFHHHCTKRYLRLACAAYAGSFRSNIAEGAHYDSPDARIDDYKKMAAAADASREGTLVSIFVVESPYLIITSYEVGDPEKYAEVIVDVVRGEGCALGKPFPSSLPLGSDAHGVIEGVCKNMIEQLGKWKDVSYSTDFLKDA
ncbi:hypothetical protein PHLCEN_2v5141 [Hermanssonia centrifuga]|uniref:NAD(P)-binding protein n=1 Tax=Hermanssonia centrifuga TaxID=98765 RepID=A0A2R6PBV1_9APHY|nr:hypothetical protein PHLCEN_2v5141 [Hermanssonia centrifuga]